MKLLSPYPALVLVILALGTISLVSRIIPLRPDKTRYETIDGLRGYLAFFVFLHHSLIWYYVIHIHVWLRPPLNLYNQFGTTSVAVFFMITSFLFFSKLIDARSGSLDWQQLYIGRVLRIVPLYLLMLGLLLLIVGHISGFTLHESGSKIISEILEWLVYIQAPINGNDITGYIVAGVIWSLPFEWMFYCSLPLVGALIFNIRISIFTSIFTSLGLIGFTMIIYSYYADFAGWWLLTFLGGIIAAFLSQNKKICLLATTWQSSVIMLVLLVLAVAFFTDVFSVIPYMCMVLFFIGVACGNSLFGLLTHRLSRIFGQITYSMYLLHGILLFVTFNYIIIPSKAILFSPLQHWFVLAGCSVALVIICSLTYYYLERPFQKAAGITALWLRRRLSSDTFRPPSL